MSERSDPLPHDAPTLGDQAAIGRIGAALFGGSAELPTIGSYQVLERLGAGAFGTVYVARHATLHQRYALKLAHRVELDPLRLERQRREWRTLAAVSHPCIVQVIDVGQTADGRWYFTMPLCDGGDLRRWLAATHSLDEVLDMLAMAASGLAAAHRAGVVHRDFKPDNVLIRAGRAVVADFGLARELPDARELADARGRGGGEAMHSGRAGTPAYMAPEQILHGVCSTKSDQFAFCVTAFEALTGARPFRGRTAIELARAAEAGDIHGAQLLPPRLRDAIVRGLAADPNARHRDLDALVAALQHRGRHVPWAAAVVVAGTTLLFGTASAATNTTTSDCPSDTTTADAGAAIVALAQTRLDRARADAVAARVERFVARSSDAVAAICEGTHTTAEALFDRQTTCLGRAELALHTLAAHAPHAKDGTDLVLATLALPDPQACLDPVEPELPSIAAESRARIEADLERARTGYLLGDDANAELAAREATRAAEAEQWVDAAARAKLWSAQLALRRSDAEAAAALAEAAFVGAESSHDDVLAASAAIVAITANGTGRRDLAVADQWARRAEAALERIADPSQLRARWLLARASTRIVVGRFDEARPLLDQALADRDDAPLDPAAIALLGDAGVLATFTGDSETAERLGRRALAASLAVFGMEHPATAAAHGNLSVALLARGRYREAEAEARAALAIGDAHGAHAIAYRIDLGIALQCRGNLQDAIATYRGALADADTHREADPIERVQILVNLADALSHAAQHDEARTAVARARVELDAVVGADHPARAMVLAAEAAAARRRGQAALALAAAEQATAFEGLPPPWRMPVLLELGEALLAADRPADALAPLREAALLTGFDARVSAQVAAALANALRRTGDATGARSVAALALGSYPDEGEPVLAAILADLAGSPAR